MEVKNIPENNEKEENGFRRSIKTFVIRAGHFTNAEKNAYNNLLPVWGIPISDKKTDFEKIFGNSAPLTVEIGFGMGKATALIAEANPDKNYIGIEVHKPGIGKLLGEIESRSLKNLRIIEGDALDALENMFEDESVDAFHIFFPDPWQKKRHFKRRLVQRPRTDLLSKKLKGGGYIYFVTDWLPYAEFALSELEATPGIKNKFERFAPHQEWRPETRFEQKGTEANRVITEILFGKI